MGMWIINPKGGHSRHDSSVMFVHTAFAIDYCVSTHIIIICPEIKVQQNRPATQIRVLTGRFHPNGCTCFNIQRPTFSFTLFI